jgi:hypothetical protein
VAYRLMPEVQAVPIARLSASIVPMEEAPVPAVGRPKVHSFDVWIQAI